MGGRVFCNGICIKLVFNFFHVMSNGCVPNNILQIVSFVHDVPIAFLFGLLSNQLSIIPKIVPWIMDNVLP